MYQNIDACAKDAMPCPTDNWKKCNGYIYTRGSGAIIIGIVALHNNYFKGSIASMM